MTAQAALAIPGLIFLALMIFVVVAIILFAVVEYVQSEIERSRKCAKSGTQSKPSS